MRKNTILLICSLFVCSCHLCLPKTPKAAKSLGF